MCQCKGGTAGASLEVDFIRQGRKEGNVLFNDALNTFYFRLYGDIW